MGFDAYDRTFSRGPSRFVKWTLSPFLLLFPVLMAFQSIECWNAGRTTGLVLCVGISAICIFGLLAMWGVRHAGRLVPGGLALLYVGYIAEECFVRFDGNWGWGRGRSADTPLNSIIGFLVIGLPCLLYTILGRFTLRPPVETDDELEDAEEVEEDDGERDTSTIGEKLENTPPIPTDTRQQP